MPDPIPGDTWTYSGDPSTSALDEVRFLAQDTDPEFPILLDTEIAYLIGKWTPLRGSNTYVAAAAAALIARKLTALVNVSADGVDVGLEDLADRYKQVATDLRAEYVEEAETDAEALDASSIMLDEDYDPSIRPLNFAIGMHDNPEAGRQDYGSNGYPPLAWDVWPDGALA